jgi:hypothetical protein
MMKKLIPYLLLLVTFGLRAQPLQEYYFNSTFTGTGGGGSLTELLTCNASAGAFGTDSVKTTNGLCSVSDVFCFNAGGGVSYPNNSITGSYTINLFFKFNTLSGYSRIIDFSNSATDAGFYLLNNCLNFYPNGNVGTCPYFQPNVYYLFTFVRDGATNVISVYVNGVLFGSYTDTGNIYKPATTSTPIIFFRDDNVVTCEAKAGCIKYASISAQQLTAQQVDSIWQNICNISLPPCSATISYPGSPYSNAISTPQPVTLSGAAGGTYTSTAGLTIDANTGAINPATSTPGTYTVTYSVAGNGSCTAFSTTASVTISSSLSACSAQGNVIVFTNYDGGTLNIDVDANIPNLKIGVVSYEPVQINLTGTYAANVAKVIRAGFPNTNNQHCNPVVTSTSINGPTPANYSIYDIPASTLNNPNGYNFGIICAYTCNTTTNQGGCNTIDQVLDYFNNQFGGGSLYSLNAQYCCWKSSNTYHVSALGNSCCVNSTGSATINYTGSPYCTNVNTPQSVSITGTTGGTYSAAQGLSLNASTGAVNPSQSTPGTYTVTYTLPGCPDFTTTATVVIGTGGSASIAYSSNSYCTGAGLQNVTITGTTGGTFGAGNGLAINTTTGQIDPANSSTGNYTVTYTLPNGSCNGSAATTQVSIVPVVTTAIADSICPGASYNFAGQQLNAAGQYSDTTTAASGCDSVTTLQLSIKTTPAALVTAANSTFCPGDSVSVCATPGAAAYLWNTGGTGSCIQVKNAGNYYVTVTGSNNCQKESNHISLNTYPTPSVSVSVSGDTLSAYNASSYQWLKDGSLINGATNNRYVVTEAGSYQVMVTDSNGCTATSNAISANPTGINDLDNSALLRVQPNPLQSGNWVVECDTRYTGGTIEVYDANGRIVYNTTIRQGKTELNFEAAKGVYYLRVNHTGNSRVVKLVKL